MTGVGPYSLVDLALIYVGLAANAGLLMVWAEYITPQPGMRRITFAVLAFGVGLAWPVWLVAFGWRAAQVHVPRGVRWLLEPMDGES